MATQVQRKPQRFRTTWVEVLVLKPEVQSRNTVRRYFERWREELGMPERCDNAECQFHVNPLTWNGKPLPLILDHSNGNRFDNKPSNLRFLCPNCDSQQVETRGGANRGRVVEIVEGGASLRERDGTISTSRAGAGVSSGYGVATGIVVDSEIEKNGT